MCCLTTLLKSCRGFVGAFCTKELSHAEARERGQRLVALLDLLVREGVKQEDNGSLMCKEPSI